jgi:hypothetical protein
VINISGRNKTKASKESTSSWGNASSLQESADDMSTWYKEFEVSHEMSLIRLAHVLKLNIMKVISQTSSRRA